MMSKSNLTTLTVTGFIGRADEKITTQMDKLQVTY